MPMPPYPVLCSNRGCVRPAEYKIAARWSDGLTEELKTYALCCSACLAEQYALCLKKQAACRRAPGERLDVPAVFELARGVRDSKLVRRPDLETSPPT